MPSAFVHMTEYRRRAVEWDEARDTTAEANRLFDQLHAHYKAIRDSDEGRTATTGLLDDPVTAVRLAAATHSLMLDQDRAVAVLEAIEAEDGVHAVTPKWTLRSFRAGTLNLDW